MLPRLGETSSGISRIGRLFLIAVGLAALSAPLIYFTRSRHAQAGDGGEAVAAVEPAGDAEFLPPLSEIEKKITAELEKPSSMEFNETPLGDVIDYLKDLHSIQIQLDHNALEDAGIDAKSLVNCDLKGVSLHSTLQLALGKLQLAAVVQNEVLLITTKEKASTLLVVRTYPVGDLIQSRDQKNYSQLIQTITNTVKPTSWEDGGGEGRIEPFSNASSIVIAQTSDVHNQVLQLLRSLRAARKAAGSSADLPDTPEPPRPARPRGGGMGGGMGGGKVGGGMGGGMGKGGMGGGMF